MTATDLNTEAVICCIIVSNPANGERPHAWQKRVTDLMRAQRDRIAELEASPGVTVDVEALAAILWREQAVDVGAPLSVSAGRTHEEFAKQSPETRAPFLKYAKAALRALTGEPS